MRKCYFQISQVTNGGCRTRLDSADRNVETVDSVELVDSEKDRRSGGKEGEVWTGGGARKFVGRKRPRVPGGPGLIIRESQNPGRCDWRRAKMCLFGLTPLRGTSACKRGPKARRTTK